MGFCAPGCPPDTITGMTGAGCRIVTRPAGLDRAIWKTCDTVFSDLTSLSEWETHIANGKIIASGRILGQKPKGSPSKKRLASCLPERTVNYSRTYQWKDSNADLAALTEFDLYQTVDQNQDVLDIGFYTCDGLFLGWFSDYSLDVDDTRGETNDDDATMECSCEIKSRYISKPTKIPGLAAVLNAANS